MAEHFTTIGSYATVEVTGPTTAEDVFRITFRTIPSGVVASYSAPYRDVGGFSKADVDQVATLFIEPLAAGIERMMGLGVVAGAVAAEDTDRAGLLHDYLDVTVEYIGTRPGQGSFSQVVRIEVGAFDEGSFFFPLIRDPIIHAYEALQALAAA